MIVRQKMSLIMLCTIFSVCNGLEEVSEVPPSLDLTTRQVKSSWWTLSWLGAGELKIETLRLDL